jgi:hypothetical protein
MQAELNALLRDNTVPGQFLSPDARSPLNMCLVTTEMERQVRLSLIQVEEATARATTAHTRYMAVRMTLEGGDQDSGQDGGQSDYDSDATKIYPEYDSDATQLYSDYDSDATKFYPESDSDATQLYSDYDSDATQPYPDQVDNTNML